MQLVECVPNFSEGRRPEVIAAIRHAAAAVSGRHGTDVHADPTHNRMVLTFVGSPEAVTAAAFGCAEQAARLIDMTVQTGEHPRIGATDVIPFVPIAGVTMETCIELANDVGRRLGEELGIPVYLYARAARRPERVRLPDVRRGQYEGLRGAIQADPDRAPDFGPARPGTAATAVGARPFLVANVNLASADLALAKRIAVPSASRAQPAGRPGARHGYGRPQRRPDLDESPGHHRDAAARRLRGRPVPGGGRGRRRRERDRRAAPTRRDRRDDPRTSRRSSSKRRRSSRRGCCKR